MVDKELKRLSRANLLELLLEQSEQIEDLQAKLTEAEQKLQSKEIFLQEAGSIAEASLRLNGVFEAAEAAGQQYLDNIKRLSERQNMLCAQREKESKEKAAKLLQETEEKCTSMEKDTAIKCKELLERTQLETEAKWAELSHKLEAFYKEHIGLRELLGEINQKQPGMMTDEEAE